MGALGSACTVVHSVYVSPNTSPSALLRAAVEFPDSVSAAQAEALKAAFGGPTPNGAAPMAEVGAWGAVALGRLHGVWISAAAPLEVRKWTATGVYASSRVAGRQ